MVQDGEVEFIVVNVCGKELSRSLALGKRHSRFFTLFCMNVEYLTISKYRRASTKGRMIRLLEATDSGFDLIYQYLVFF